MMTLDEYRDIIIALNKSKTLMETTIECKVFSDDWLTPDIAITDKAIKSLQNAMKRQSQETINLEMEAANK